MLQGLSFTLFFLPVLQRGLPFLFFFFTVEARLSYSEMDAGSQVASGPQSYRDCQVCSYLRGEDKTGAVTAGPSCCLVVEVPILVAGAIGWTCCDTDTGAENHVSWRNTIGIIRERFTLYQSAVFEKHQIASLSVYWSCNNVTIFFVFALKFVYLILGGVYFLIDMQKY